MTLRVGFLGAGFISRTHNFFLKHCPVDHRVVAVHDLDIDRARALADRHGAEVAGVDRLLDLVDVAFITAWTSEHEALVTAAAERGVAVFCEKPLAFDAPTARRMADTVENAGVANQVGLVLRSLPQFRFARRLLGDERAGRVMTVSFRDDQFIPVQGHYESTWRSDPARSGRGTLLEHSIHDVDILSYLLGQPRSASGLVREFHDLDRIDDLTVARLEYANGAVASLTSIWHDMVDRPSQRLIEIFCERLYVRLDGTPDGPLTWRFTGGKDQVLQGRELAEACIAVDLGRSVDLLDTGSGSMFNPVTPFLEAIESGAPSPLPLRAAVAAHEVVDAIYASSDDAGAPRTLGVGGVAALAAS